jgi:hypothetical protein
MDCKVALASGQWRFFFFFLCGCVEKKNECCVIFCQFVYKQCTDTCCVASTGPVASEDTCKYLHLVGDMT